jgi:hypothetical protein
MDKLLTYRYPRTLAEASMRYACDAQDAIAMHGPYRRPLVADTWVAIATVIACLVGIGASFVRGIF